MIIFHRPNSTISMTTSLFKLNYLSDLPLDVKEVIKNKKNELDKDISVLQTKIDTALNPDTTGIVGNSIMSILTHFKYMNDYDFDEIDFNHELLSAIAQESTLRESVNDLDKDDEDYEFELEQINEVTNQIKKVVNDYGVFEILKQFKENKGYSLIDFSEHIDGELCYNICYAYYLELEFNSKFSYNDIVNIRKFSMTSEHGGIL